MITPADGIRYWFHRWSNLRAWGRPVEHVTLTVSTRETVKRLGTCYPHRQKVIVYLSGSMTEDLATLLHELAHTVAGNGHDDLWSECYARAVMEVTGGTMATHGDALDLDRAAEELVRAWWKRSGNESLWRMAQGKVA